MKALPIILTTFLLFTSAQAQYSGGTGERNNPYQINTAKDLIRLGHSPKDSGKHFILTADIDLDHNLPGGRVINRAVIPDFSGTFDGNGFIISNLTIVGDSDLGLFGLIREGAEVNRLTIADASVIGSGDRIGILCGRNGRNSMRAGRIVDCACTGEVSGNRYVGGLVGMNYRGRILDCFSTGTASGKSDITFYPGIQLDNQKEVQFSVQIHF